MKRRIFTVIIVFAVIGGAGLAWRLAGATGSPVPAGLRSSAGFPIYYPDQGHLPDGYTLDTTSFQKADGGAIIYAIKNSSGGNLIASEVAQPGGNVIDDFTKNSIPLHSTVDTSLGKAQIGAYGSPPNLRSIVSLPINHGPWLIITAPANTPQTDLKQITLSLRQ
jgi:hypothetical protein